MASSAAASIERPVKTAPGDRLVLAGIATCFALFHLLTNGRYGFHRDELQFLSDARHLDWGFVAYPPLTPFLERVLFSIFGASLVVLRLFSVLAQGIVILVSGLMARDLGGGRLAQVTAALCVGLSPVPIFEATEYQYTSFEFLWWVLIAWFVIRLLRSGNARWWLAIGAAVGLGLETKYSIVFYIAGILAGMALSQVRRFWKSGYFWGGIGLALLIFLPNLLWQAKHHFISYEFLRHIHRRDVGEGRAEGFLRDQLWLCVNLFAAPVWIAGLTGYLRSGRYRMLGWMYLVPVILFWLAKGRFYYVSAAYPMLLAMGAVMGEAWVRRMRSWSRRSIEAVFFAGLAAVGGYVIAILVPMASSGPLRDFCLSKNGDLREEIGWDELVRTVAQIRDSMPAEEQAHLGIRVGNYGEQGAIELLGPAYHLPDPISTTNSAWLRGYPSSSPTTIIVVGLSQKQAESEFTGCRLAGHNGNALSIRNEESTVHPDIFVCGPPRLPWPQFWKQYQSFG